MLSQMEFPRYVYPLIDIRLCLYITSYIYPLFCLYITSYIYPLFCLDMSSDMYSLFCLYVLQYVPPFQYISPKYVSHILYTSLHSIPPLPRCTSVVLYILNLILSYISNTSPVQSQKC